MHHFDITAREQQPRTPLSHAATKSFRYLASLLVINLGAYTSSQPPPWTIEHPFSGDIWRATGRKGRHQLQICLVVNSNCMGRSIQRGKIYRDT